MTVELAHSLTDISFPEHAVVVGDRHLPSSILEPLDDPILVAASEELKTLDSIGKLAKRVLDRRSSRPLT